ncbi:MAG TPA: radical SAM/Cys-rich domain protein [Clostridia bacterium]|nr:radical SAM/Cys-rich domain protein [Clostridia bacterium]
MTQLDALGQVPGLQPFAEKLQEIRAFPLKSKSPIHTMQVNTGALCNLNCRHCHVEAGPHRRETMSLATMAQCLQLLADAGLETLDITGGAPELNPHHRWLIQEARRLGCRVMTRCNLTVLDLEPYRHFPEFYAEHGVEIVASLPHYAPKNTDRVRGNGVFQTSIQVLQRLNRLGYGREGSGLTLNLVYNPAGAFLPGDQSGLEADFRRHLAQEYGITFNHLFALGNFPVGRFLTFLQATGNLESYLSKLAAAFNPATVPNVMCRDQISVRWDGYLFDCDFNQMLDLRCRPVHVSQCRPEDLVEREIAVHNHCYACTAGSGSSCGGAIA